MAAPVLAGLPVHVSRQPWRPAPGRVPAGRRVHAIGDVHGHADLLDGLLGLIAAERDLGPATLVMLGDYVDRGPDSAEVIARLAGLAWPGLDLVCLRGNHEDFLCQFLDAPGSAAGWLECGGDRTMHSYGCVAPGRAEVLADPRRADGFRRRFPPAHRRFLDGLRPCHRLGDYLFVHAGIRPGIALERQSAQDMCWIREPFLEAEGDHGAVIVHGHSISQGVEIRHNRIGVDTGAYAAGRLSCLSLEGGRLRVSVAWRGRL